MALFSNFDMAAVIGEAYQHNAKVLERELQPYNDMLFKIISDEIKTKRDDILEQFKTQIKETPGRARVVSVPLWTYNVRHFLTSREEYQTEFAKLTYMERVNKSRENRELYKLHEDNGWHWKIGVLSPVQWLDEDTNWSLRPVPVDLVVGKTDLLLRLSNLFADTHVWVKREYDGFIHDDDRCKINKIVLRAHFHVEGLGRHVMRTKALKRVQDKYARYQNYAPEEGHQVTLIGPGLEPPKTPPASPAVPPTPKAPRRADGGIHHYTGPNAMSEGARDFVASILDENAPCHCRYCDYDSE